MVRDLVQSQNFNKTQTASLKKPSANNQDKKQARGNKNIEGKVSSLKNTANRNGGIDTNNYMNTNTRRNSNTNIKTKKPPARANQHKIPEKLPDDLKLKAPGRLKKRFYTYKNKSGGTTTINPNRSGTMPLVHNNRVLRVNAREYADTYSYFTYHAAKMGFGVRDDFILEGADSDAGEINVDPELQNIAEALAVDAAGEYSELKEQFKQGLISKEALQSGYTKIISKMKQKLKDRQKIKIANAADKIKTKKAREANIISAKQHVTNKDKAILAGAEYKKIEVKETDKPQYAST